MFLYAGEQRVDAERSAAPADLLCRIAGDQQRQNPRVPGCSTGSQAKPPPGLPLTRGALRGDATPDRTVGCRIERRHGQPDADASRSASFAAARRPASGPSKASSRSNTG